MTVHFVSCCLCSDLGWRGKPGWLGCGAALGSARTARAGMTYFFQMLVGTDSNKVNTYQSLIPPLLFYLAVFHRTNCTPSFALL